MSETIQLLREIEGFIREAGMAASTFGRKAVNDGKLVGRLQTGSTVTLEKASRIRAFIKANPPNSFSSAKVQPERAA